MGADRPGAGCVIHHHVTIGMDRKGNHPEIDDHVWIGPDTIIYAQKIGSIFSLLSGAAVGEMLNI